MSYETIPLAKSSRWVMRLPPRPEAKVNLFCFPYAGGEAGLFRKWAGLFPPSISIIPVQLPGRGSRIQEPCLTSMTSIVEAVADGLNDYFDKPFAFFGHSMGGVISFELARLLRSGNLPTPIQLFISGRPAPQFGELMPLSYNLPLDQFIERLRELNGTPAQVFENKDLLDLIVPILRADFEACQTYSYKAGSPAPCGITAFSGVDDKITREQMEGWKEHSSGFFDLRMLPGDHFFLHQEQKTIADVISRQMQQFLFPYGF